MDWLKAALLIALVEGLCASDVNEGRTFKKIPLKSFLASKLSSSTGSILPPPERERPTWKIHKYQGLELLPITDNVEEDHSSSSPDLPDFTNNDKQHTDVYPPANQLDNVDQPASSNSQISNSDSKNALEALDYLAPIANLIPSKRSIKKIHLKTLDPVEKTAASVLQLPKKKAAAASVLQLPKKKAAVASVLHLPKKKAAVASVLHPLSKGGILSSIFHKKKKPLAFFKIPFFKHPYKILPRSSEPQGDSRSFGKIFWGHKAHKLPELPKLPEVLQLSQAYIPSPPVQGKPTLIPDSTFELINQLNDITKLADHIALPHVPSLPTSLFPLKFKKHHQLKPYIHIKLPARQITTEHPPERKDIITSVEPENSYGPPSPPENSYGPPSPPENSYGPPSPPENSYGPPYKPVNTYGAPPPTVDRYESPPYKPQDSYGPPPTPGNIYGPPPPPENSYGPPSPPKDTNISPRPADNYGPPQKPGDIYRPPPPAVSYGAPSPPVDSYGPPPPADMYGPPPQEPIDTYRPPLPPADSYGLPPSNPAENYGAPPSTSLSSNQWSFSTHYQSPSTVSDSYGNPINNGWSNESTPYDRLSQSSNHQGSPVYIHKDSPSAAASERDDVLVEPPPEVVVENREDSERVIP